MLFASVSIYAQNGNGKGKGKGKGNGQMRGNGQMMKKTPEERAEKMTNRLKMTLNLSDDQVAKAREINLKTAQSMKEVKEKHKQEMMSDFKKIEDETDARYKEILTAEQFAKYQQMKEQRKQKMKEKMKKMENEMDGDDD